MSRAGIKCFVKGCLFTVATVSTKTSQKGHLIRRDLPEKTWSADLLRAQVSHYQALQIVLEIMHLHYIL